MPVGWTVRAGVTAALLAGLLAIAACSTKNNPSSGPTTTSTAPGGSGIAESGSSSTSASMTASGTPGSPADTQEIRTAFVAFFKGSTPAAEKIKLLQNGSKFASAINAQASSPIAKGTEATVSKVTIVAQGQADVVYSISLAGKTALSNQTGMAVRQDGAWKVADSTFCALLALQGTKPAACSGVAASPSASPS